MKTSEITTQTCRTRKDAKVTQNISIFHVSTTLYHTNVFTLFRRPPSAPADSILRSFDRPGPIAAPWMEGTKPCQ